MQEILLFLQHQWLLSSALLIIFMLLAIVEFFKIKRGTHRLSPAQVIQLINHENAAVVDIRSAEIFTSGHIVGSLSIPSRELSDKLKRIEKYKAQPVIIVCATGMDANNAATLLEKNGFLRTYILDGGIRNWRAAEMPLVKD